MKTLNQYIKEKLIINKDYRDVKMYHPKSFDELRKIIEDRYDKLGPGTKRNPIDFNDIDVSHISSFYNNKGLFGNGLFQDTNFKYIDISEWDVSNVESMSHMFYWCKELRSVGDISKWDVSNVKSMRCMFSWCKELKSVGDISSWDVSNVNNMAFMFAGCENFNKDLSGWDVSNVNTMSSMFDSCKSFNQDISGWNVSGVTNMQYMFDRCESFNQDLSNWDVSNVKFKASAFRYCPIKEEYKPKFK